MLEQTMTDGVAAKGLQILERALDGDEGLSPNQQRAAVTALSSEIKTRAARNRDISNAITVIKMHPDKTLRESAADTLLRRLLPDASAAWETESRPALAGASGQ